MDQLFEIARKTFDTPEFRDITFIESEAKSIVLEHRWEHRHRRTVGHRGESETPPEPEGPSGFSGGKVAGTGTAAKPSVNTGLGRALRG